MNELVANIFRESVHLLIYFIENNVYLIVITGEYFKTKSRFEIAVLVDTVNMLRHFLSVSIDCSAEPE
jgi:hypothetical protein